MTHNSLPGDCYRADDPAASTRVDFLADLSTRRREERDAIAAATAIAAARVRSRSRGFASAVPPPGRCA